MNGPIFKATEDVIKHVVIEDHKIKVYFKSEEQALKFATGNTEDEETELIKPIVTQE